VSTAMNIDNKHFLGMELANAYSEIVYNNG